MSRKETDFYCQCTLKRTESDTFTVSWIPHEFAIQDKLLSLKDINNKWDDWIVQSVGEKIRAELVEARRDDYRDWRNFTDI